MGEKGTGHYVLDRQKGGAVRKILFIPHHPATTGIRIRLVEMAKALSANNDVYLLSWNAVSGEYTLGKRISVSLRDLFKTARTYGKDGLSILEFPTLHRPVSLAHRFNRISLMRFIGEENVDTVINGSYYLFTLPEKRKVKYVVDFADLPSAGYAEEYVKREAQKADHITVASEGLAEYVQEACRRDAHFVPNGVHIEKMRSVTRAEVEDLRRKHNLSGKYVFGYIGYIGNWVNVELVTKAFTLFKKEFPASALLWIGPGPKLEELRSKYSGADIIFAGGIDDGVEAYFRVLDAGLLPTRKSPFQDKAFHLKLIEYTAAGKPVVSTPLEESMRLKLPNVIFTEEDEVKWSAAFKRASEMRWQEKWNALASQYDWENIAGNLLNIISEGS